ncbi:MAG: non-homologous end-joining DNA ligase [Bacteroidia bacterium]
MKNLETMLSKTGNIKDLVKDGYIYEPKLDGVRAFCYKAGNEIEFINRRERNITARYPELNFPELINTKSCILDGEIIVYNEKGNPDFHLLMRRDQSSNPMLIKIMSEDLPATYAVFDICMKDGKDLTDLPLYERKAILENLINESPRLQIMHYTDDGLGLWSFIMNRHLEGVVAKKENSTYEAGKRSGSWMKIKNFKTQDCIIVGFSQEKRVISALALAAYQNGKLRFLGKVGTGFKQSFLHELYDQLKGITIDKPDFRVPSHYKGINWVQPKLACEVQYLEFGSDGMLRSPSFQRLRNDKPLKECILELPEDKKLKSNNGYTKLAS